ncbi:MAG TPA: sensor domain-containing diguanylate cyclase [Candidatus Saccharimonadales bacterium]|nr:sensor domain-containing diguanylate cyclase [Candidatus Saccharimonadales bacterium]
MNQTIFLLVGAGILALGITAGMMVMRRKLGSEVSRLESRLRDMQRHEDENRTLLTEAQAESQNLSSFLVMLPDLARQLNSHLDRRNIAQLLANALEHIFDPSRILIYFSRHEEKQLYLAYKKGVSETVPLGLKVGYNEGMTGWIAESRQVMDKDDFHGQSTGLRRGARIGGRVNEEQLGLDLLAPMSYEDECLGVICIGGSARKPSDQKRMIKLVSDLGSLALYNNLLYTSFQAMANSDALTKMYTKRYLLVRLGSEIHRAEKANQPLSVFMFDIDHFKKYNDAHGHLAGDDLLRMLSKTVRHELREDDVAARYGGEEFVVLLPGIRKSEALTIAEKIRRTIEMTRFPNAGTQPLGKVTISGGVSTLGEDAKTSSELLKAADDALYESKQRGRNLVLPHRIRYLSDEEEEEVREADPVA